MKAVILAGGLGTRISEETHLRPKPMIEIGGKPILWHIMKIYSAYDINDFIICCGYRGYLIKEYFANYGLHMSDVTVDLRSNRTTIHRSVAEPWSITLVDTGDRTMTGGRLKRVRDYLADDEPFCFTYGDGVADIDVAGLLAAHRDQKRIATMTAVQPPGRFGRARIEGNAVTAFTEKPVGDGAWINGGFFVLEKAAINYIADDHISWENEPLQDLAANGQLSAYKHGGFWQPMDTLRDKAQLEDLWSRGEAPWKIWR
jgi:glucose-1-phosphate cytidylyltransferase